MNIHPTALLSPSAKLGADVCIGPYSVIGEDVSLGDRTSVGSHVVIDGWTEVGRDCRIFSHAVIGTEPQDLKFRGEKTYVFIGDGAVIREFATINRATVGGGAKTVVGPRSIIMAYAHVAHDCLLGTQVILANAATLGGHVFIEDHAIVGGLCAIHQFCRIGRYAIVGGCTGVNLDIPPFVKAQGNRVRLFGLNSIGLKRHNFPEEALRNLRKAYRILFRSGLNTSEGLARIEAEIRGSAEVDEFVRFVKTSQRGIAR